jgi:hypothetical protein
MRACCFLFLFVNQSNLHRFETAVCTSRIRVRINLFSLVAIKSPADQCLLLLFALR